MARPPPVDPALSLHLNDLALPSTLELADEIRDHIDADSDDTIYADQVAWRHDLEDLIDHAQSVQSTWGRAITRLQKLRDAAEASE